MYCYCICELIKLYKEHSSVNAILESFEDNPVKSEFKNVNSNYVEKCLAKLNRKRATRYDRLFPKIVKMCSHELVVTLTELNNHTFGTSQFPEDMKKAAISPVFETIANEQLLKYFTNIFERHLKISS